MCIRDSRSAIDKLGEMEDDAANALGTAAIARGDALENDGEITLPGIGKLKVSERPARTGRNPQTLSLIHI